MIGKGNFAKVHLCKRTADDQTFALKSVEKTLIKKSKRNSVSNLFIHQLQISRAQFYVRLTFWEVLTMNMWSNSMRCMRVTNTFIWFSNT